jgi:NTE family protein
MPLGLEALPRPVVYVYGGGGARGAAHAGMMQAVGETGHKPDAVIGTSVGSISAAVTAENPDVAAQRMSDVWRVIKRGNIFPGGRIDQLARLQHSKRFMFSQDGLRATIRKYMPTVRIQDLALPYAAVATDYNRAEPMVLQSGSLETAIAASSAIPVVYPMVEVAGTLLCDGGVVANVPVVEAQLLNPKSLVVFDCIGPVNTAKANLIDIAAGTAGIMQHKQRVADISHVSDRLPIVYLPPPKSVGSPLDFSHTEELISDCYESSSAFLADLDLPKDPPTGLYGEIPSVLPPDLDAYVRQPANGW